MSYVLISVGANNEHIGIQNLISASFASHPTARRNPIYHLSFDWLHPIEIQSKLIAESERVDAILARISDPQERARRAYLEHRRLFGKWDDALDSATSGPFWLRNPKVAELVMEALHYRNGRVYDLDAFCIMPNHVHVVYTPLRKEDDTYYAMSGIMHSLKGRSAREANLILGRSGDFWQHENYDHVVRDEAEWRRIVTYVLNNPVKANLVRHWEDWPWTYSKYPM